MRLVCGTAVIANAYLAMRAGLPGRAELMQAASVSCGVLVIVGLKAVWNAFSACHPWGWIMLATLGAALALIGPGAWSLDSRLFGWKRLDI
jgi:putative oxidoreductase